MRQLSEEIVTNINNLSSFHYCYEITLTTAINRIFLTSANSDIQFEGVLYKANCGLSVKEAHFNDSAQDYIVLEGVFDSEVINDTLELIGAEVKIFILSLNNLTHLASYRCTLYNKYDLSFVLRLEPDSIQYNQTLLKSYSKTCRAKFGDNKCKFDKQSVSVEYDVIEILGTDITLSHTTNEPNGYFTAGDAALVNTSFKTKILFHYKNKIKLVESVHSQLKHHTKIILTAGCDKKFLTCCNKFNNAVNFRGEPSIPEHGFLKAFYDSPYT